MPGSDDPSIALVQPLQPAPLNQTRCTASSEDTSLNIKHSSEKGRANWQFAWFPRKTASMESRQTASLPYTRAAIFILSGRRNPT
jgi:hypothetical protein